MILTGVAAFFQAFTATTERCGTTDWYTLIKLCIGYYVTFVINTDQCFGSLTIWRKRKLNSELKTF